MSAATVRWFFKLHLAQNLTRASPHARTFQAPTVIINDKGFSQKSCCTFLALQVPLYGYHINSPSKLLIKSLLIMNAAALFLAALDVMHLTVSRLIWVYECIEDSSTLLNRMPGHRKVPHTL
jgi:hypothetical protein